MDFPYWFSKSDLVSVRYIFLRSFLSEKAKYPKICLSIGGSMPETQIKQCPLIPPYQYGENINMSLELRGGEWDMYF